MLKSIKKGFTLTEVAISVAIVAGLTAAVAVGVNAVASDAQTDAGNYGGERDSMIAEATGVPATF